METYTGKSCHGCTFVARAAEAYRLSDVRELYRALMLNPQNMSATHNVAAYRLYNPQGAKTEEGHNDNDYGICKTVKDALGKKNAKNFAVFITRFYGGKHLGPKDSKKRTAWWKMPLQSMNRNKISAGSEYLSDILSDINTTIGLSLLEMLYQYYTL